jgi:hypothetical protein
MIFMAQPIDAEFLNDLRIYLKAEWMKNGQKSFAKSLDQIAMDMMGISKNEIKSSLRNKIFRSLKLLENGGSLKIEHGEGSQPNKFSYVDDKFIKELNDNQIKKHNTIDEIANEGTNFVQKYVDLYNALFEESQARIGELNLLKQAINSLEPCGFGLDNVPMYKPKPGSDLPLLLEKLQKEHSE